MTIMHKFLDVSPENKALLYIAERIEDDNYRGTAPSQHNRYTLDDVFVILTLLDEYAPQRSLLPIRTTDLSKRIKVNPDEVNYTKFCEECKEKTRIGSPDPMRKNLFLDFHRMLLIERYDVNKNKIDPYKRKPVKFVSLSEFGMKFIKSNLFDRYFIFTRCLDQLLGGQISMFIDIIRNTPDINTIDINEYVFFMTAFLPDRSFSKNIPEIIDLIKKYRLLTSLQRKSVIHAIKKEMTPNTKINKTKCKDYHNWLNASQQVFKLLGQTIYFEVDHNNTKLTLRTKIGKNKFHAKKLIRSKSEQDLYFKKHDVDRKDGFELHHVVPLSWAEGKHHFKLLDDWKNMTYIDGYNHAKITQNKSRNVVMSNNGNNIILADYTNHVVELIFLKNIHYQPSKQQTMLEYNKQIRESFDVNANVLELEMYKE